MPNYEAQSGGTKRFIGRKLDPNQGTPFQDPVTKRMARHAVFVAVQGPEAFHEIDASTPHAKEYRDHLRDGDLLPGDPFTAEWAGVKFDPTYKDAAFWELPDEPEDKAKTVDELHEAALKLVVKPPVAATLSTVAPKSTLSDSKVST